MAKTTADFFMGQSKIGVLELASSRNCLTDVPYSASGASLRGDRNKSVLGARGLGTEIAAAEHLAVPTRYNLEGLGTRIGLVERLGHIGVPNHFEIRCSRQCHYRNSSLRMASEIKSLSDGIQMRFPSFRSCPTLTRCAISLAISS